VSLPWNKVQSCLPDYYNLSLNHLHHLQHLIKQPELLKEYHHIILDQLQKGIIEQIKEESTPNLSLLEEESGKVHYMPHRTVVQRERATTIICIVYDGSAKLHYEPSLMRLVPI